MNARSIRMILAVFCLLISQAVRADVPLMGDVTGPAGPDGVVDLTDAIRVLKTVLGRNYIFQDEFVKSDVAPLNLDGTRGDGILDIRDVITDLRWSLGLDSPPQEPSSLYCEGIASLGFPNTGTSLVRRLAFSLRWAAKPGMPLEGRAILFPARCIGYALPTTPVELRGVEDANHQLTLEGGYVPVHPIVRFGERVQIRLKIDLTSDVKGDAGHRELLGSGYEEEIRGLAPEPLIQDGRFAVTSKFIDPEPLNRLRDPLFPTKPSSFQGPAADSYRRSAPDETTAAAKVASGFIQFAQNAKTSPELSSFLNAKASGNGLYDSVDALQAVAYDQSQEPIYGDPDHSSAIGFSEYQNFASHALVTALPVLRTTDSSQTSDGDLLNGLRMGFLYSAAKTLEAERDIRGSENAALFTAPLTVEQEDGVLARAITEYEDALYGTTETLAIGPIARMGALEDGLNAASEGSVLPVLQAKDRDYRLLVRILDGLSGARIEHSRRALAVQDWTRTQLECEMMVFDVRYAMSLMDAQEASDPDPVTIRNSQELIQAFDNITKLGDLFTSAELQETPVGTLLNRPNPTGSDDPDRLNDSGLGAITVSQYDYPQVAESGDPALDPDPSTTLDNLVQRRIKELLGDAGTPNTLAYLQAQEQLLRGNIDKLNAQNDTLLNRQNQSASDYLGQLVAIVGKRADGSPAIAQNGETPSPQNDATSAALASWDGASTDGTWVASWLNRSGSLYAAYRAAYGDKNDILAAAQQLQLDQQKLAIIQEGMTANDQDLKNLLQIQTASDQFLQARAGEVVDDINNILNSGGSASMAREMGLSDSISNGVSKVYSTTIGVCSAVGKLLTSNKTVTCYAKKFVTGAVAGGSAAVVDALVPAAVSSVATGGVSLLGVAAAAGVGGVITGFGAAFNGECSSDNYKNVGMASQSATLNNSTAIMTQTNVTGDNNNLTISKGQTEASHGSVLKPVFSENNKTLMQVANNTYQMVNAQNQTNGEINELINVNTKQVAILNRVDNNLVSIDGKLVLVNQTLGNIDQGIANLNKVVTNSYNLQVDQYNEQIQQGQTLKNILGQETVQTQVLGQSLQQLDQIKSIGAVSAVANARLAADAERVNADMQAAMAKMQFDQRRTDLATSMLSAQSQFIADANQLDQKQNDMNDQVAKMMDLIRQARTLSAQWQNAQTNAPVTGLNDNYAVAEQYREYRDEMDLLRFKLWSLARLVEYARNDDFPAFNSDSSDPTNPSEGFNYAMVFRARNANDLTKALGQIQTAADAIPSLSAGSNLMISLKKQVMPTVILNNYNFPSPPSFTDFLKFYSASQQPIQFSTGVSGAIPVNTDGTPGSEPAFDNDPLNYEHLLWGSSIVYQGSASLPSENFSLEQEGTTLLRTADACPSVIDASGPQDEYRTIDLPTLSTNLVLSPIRGGSISLPTVRDTNRLSTFAFKNRPLVSTWDLIIPQSLQNLTDAQLSGIDDIDIVFEVNVRTKPIHNNCN